MKKQSVFLATFLIAILLLSGCGFQVVTGSGDVVKETRQVAEFTRITLAGIGDVTVTQGESYEMVIEAEDNLIPYFDVSVQDEILTIGIKEIYSMVSLHPTKPVEFHVTLPDIEAVTLAGSGNIFVNDIETGDFNIALLGSGNITLAELSARAVEISLNGSGNVSLESVTSTTIKTHINGSGNITIDMLTADKISASIAGSGDITVAGNVTEQNIDIFGSGNYTAGDLKSQVATVKVDGSGDSNLWVTETLALTINGSGDVTYAGVPRLELNINGSGNIHQIDHP